MRWILVLAFMALFFAGCTTSKQLKRYIAPNVKMMLEGERSMLQANITVWLDSSIVVPDSMIETKTIKKLFLPLIIVIIDRVKIKGTISPLVLASRFSWHLSRNAELDCFNGILKDKTLKVIVKSIPTSFIYDENNITAGTPLGTSSESSHEIKPIGNIFELEYELNSVTGDVLSDKVVLYMENKEAAHIGPREVIDRYFTRWDNSLNQASMSFLRQLMTEIKADKK